MSFDKFFPSSDVLAKHTGIIGTPYHGPVQGGVLALPNATTMTYQQPDTLHPDLACTAHLVQRPGVAAVTRSVDELAADILAGREWRNKSMLSGSRLQMYGQNLDGWIYIDSAGDRWLVKFTPALSTISLSFNVPELALTLSFTRFGAFGKDPDATTRAAGLTNYGQGGAAFAGFPSGAGSTETITTGLIAIDGIYSDGSKVALVICRFRPGYIAAGQGEDVCYRHPLGWVEVAISGPGSSPTITTTILKTREETLQVIEETDVFTTSLYSAPALAPDGAGISATVGSFNYRLENLRLLAAWPDEGTGGWTFVGLRYVNEGSGSGSVSSGGTAYTGTSSATFACTMTLEVDGAVQSTLGYTASKSYGVVVNSTGATFPAPTWTFTTTDTTTNLSVLGSSFTQVEPGSTIDGNTGTIIVTNLLQYSTIFAAGYEPQPFCYTSTWRRGLLAPTDVVTTGINSVTVDVARYSGKVFGFRYRIQATPGGAGDFVQMPRVTPSGVVGSDEAASFSETARLYASWCPHTEVLTDLENTPICWV